MKPIKIIICALFSLFFIGCIEEENQNNNQNSYVGNYLCQKTENEYDMDSIYPTVTSTETVSITKVTDSLIGILDAKVKFNPQTKIFGSGWYPDPESDYRVLYGWFSNDSLYIETYKGGLAAGVNCNYKGKKIK